MCSRCFAERAQSLDWSRPELGDGPGLHIERGRHPVVEAVRDEPFEPNDLVLDCASAGGRREGVRMLVITGPNMGAKSTYMRQNALIVLLAHIGSFVPAARAVIGPIDRILTRIGAGDDLARGQSTFMVEMSETSYILHHASAESLVLMDEIGRGTSTYDGLALADACARHLASVQSQLHAVRHPLFRTDGAGAAGSGIANVHLDAVEHHDKNGSDTLVFMHAVKDGPADRSFGLQVAALAGLPRTVVRQARARWPNSNSRARCAFHADDRASPRRASTDRPVRSRRLRRWKRSSTIEPDELTPRQALEGVVPAEVDGLSLCLTSRRCRPVRG
jgi:DNA mismatch repair protein MutS